MATVTPDKPLVTRRASSVRSSTQVRDLPEPKVEPARPVERHDAPTASTTKGYADVASQKVRVVPEKRAGFLSRMAHRIRDTAFEVGLTNRGRALYRDSQALSPREKAELDAGRMGFPQF